MPQTKIKLQHGDSLIISTLSGTLQLNALRRFLAEGFQTHLQHNPLLHQIFGFEPRAEKRDRLTPLEKRMYRSLPPRSSLFSPEKPPWPPTPPSNFFLFSSCLLQLYLYVALLYDARSPPDMHD